MPKPTKPGWWWVRWERELIVAQVVSKNSKGKNLWVRIPDGYSVLTWPVNMVNERIWISEAIPSPAPPEDAKERAG